MLKIKSAYYSIKLAKEKKTYKACKIIYINIVELQMALSKNI